MLRAAFRFCERWLHRAYLLSWLFDKKGDIGTALMTIAALGYALWDQLKQIGPIATAFCGIAAFALLMFGLNQWHKFRAPQRPEREQLPQPAAQVRPSAAKQLEPDIDAREAFFQILEQSEWRTRQLTNPPDLKTVSADLLKIRLDTQIHNYLGQGKLTAWGELNLPRGTGPLRQIPSDKWDEIEILFDTINPSIPKTVAKWRTNDRVSHFGIMFSGDEIFQLFPLASTQQDWKPVFIAIEHIRKKIGDTDSDNVFPNTRRVLRQAACDGHVKMKGRKQLSHKSMIKGDFSDVHTDIDPSYWASYEINALATSSECETDRHTIPESSDLLNERNYRAHLLVNWPDVLKVWP
jgi:hypothetical protein